MNEAKETVVILDGGVEVPAAFNQEQVQRFLELDAAKRQVILDTKGPFQETLLNVSRMHINDAVSQMKEGVENAVREASEQLQLPFSPFPTELTRVSPFYPLGTHEMEKREYLKDVIIADNSWGTIKYRGPKLSIYEEDNLLALLAVLNENLPLKTSVDVNGEPALTYTYTGPLLPILRAKGVKTPGKAAYAQAIESFKLMATASFELEIKKRDKDGKSKIGKVTFTNIVSGGVWDPETEQVSLTVNPFFANAFDVKKVTLIDMWTRSQLKSPTSRALLRFISSHKDNEWNGNHVVLAKALNVNIDLGKKKVRERVRDAIKELVKIKALTPDSGIVGDIAIMTRTISPNEAHKRARAAKIEAAKKSLAEKIEKRAKNGSVKKEA